MPSVTDPESRGIRHRNSTVSVTLLIHTDDTNSPGGGSGGSSGRETSPEVATSSSCLSQFLTVPQKHHNWAVPAGVLSFQPSIPFDPCLCPEPDLKLSWGLCDVLDVSQYVLF